jgi:hypothetical protein
MRSLRGKATPLAGGVAADAVGTVILAPVGGDAMPAAFTDAFSDAFSKASTS